MLGLSVFGLSRDDRAEAAAFGDGIGGAGALTLGLLEFDVALTVHACVAALEASGRDLSEGGSLDEDGLPSLPGLNVRSILPFFSGDGVRDFFSPAIPGDSVDALRVCVKLFSLMDPLPELFRGAIAGRYGSAGGRERSA